VGPRVDANEKEPHPAIHHLLEPLQSRYLAGFSSSRTPNGAGCSVWLDVMSLEGGQEILRTIKEAIEDANEALVLVSPQSLKSQWVSVEIGMAEVLGVRITPILNHVEHTDSAPLVSRKAYDLNDFDKFLSEVRDRIASWAEKS